MKWAIYFAVLGLIASITLADNKHPQIITMDDGKVYTAFNSKHYNWADAEIFCANNTMKLADIKTADVAPLWEKILDKEWPYWTSKTAESINLGLLDNLERMSDTYSNCVSLFKGKQRFQMCSLSMPVLCENLKI